MKLSVGGIAVRSSLWPIVVSNGGRSRKSWRLAKLWPRECKLTKHTLAVPPWLIIQVHKDEELLLCNNALGATGGTSDSSDDEDVHSPIDTSSLDPLEVQLKTCFSHFRSAIKKLIRKSGRRKSKKIQKNELDMSYLPTKKLVYPGNTLWVPRFIPHFLSPQTKHYIQGPGESDDDFCELHLLPILGVLMLAVPDCQHGGSGLDFQFSSDWNLHGRYFKLEMLEYYSLLSVIALKLPPTFGLPINKLMKAKTAHVMVSTVLRRLEVSGLIYGSTVSPRLEVISMSGMPGRAISSIRFRFNETFNGMLDYNDKFIGCTETDMVYLPLLDMEGSISNKTPDVLTKNEEIQLLKKLQNDELEYYIADGSTYNWKMAGYCTDYNELVNEFLAMEGRPC